MAGSGATLGTTKGHEHLARSRFAYYFAIAGSGKLDYNQGI